MYVLFGVCVILFFAITFYIAIDIYERDNERMVKHADSGGYRSPEPSIRTRRHNVGSLEIVRHPENDNDGRKDS